MTDYNKAILDRVTATVGVSHVWSHDSDAAVCRAVRARVSGGAPLDPKDAILLAGLLPPLYNVSLPPLKVVHGGVGPAADNLLPDVTQGVKSWYWNLTHFIGEDGERVGVLVVFRQTAISAGGRGLPATSAWCLYGGLVSSVDGVWQELLPKYFTDAEVQFDRTTSTLTFESSEAKGSFHVTPTEFQVAVFYKDTAQAFHVNSTTGRGATYEQSGGNLTQLGPLQNGYWSIVDGVVNGGMVQAPASVFDTATTRAQLSLPRAYTVGTSWLDYQQVGFAGVTPAERFALSLIRTNPAASARWLFVTIQSPTIQANAYCMDTKDLAAFGRKAPTAVLHTGNVWKAGQAAQYGVPVTFQLVETYPGTTVPSKVKVTFHGVEELGTCTLTSFSKNAPLLMSAGGSGYESPATVQHGNLVSTASTGVIEWVPQGLYPTVKQAIQEAGLDSVSIQAAWAPSPLATTTAVLIAVGVLVAVVLCIMLPVVVIKKAIRSRHAS